MISIQNIFYSYRKKEVLHDITINFGKGIHGLLGPNGCGKTTLMRCIAGITRPQKGQICGSLDIGYLPQKFGMFPELTAYEVLDYFAVLKKIPVNERKDTITHSLNQVHLYSHKDEKIRTLSGGMIRRLGIAQAIIGNPEVILVDEPTAGLDPEERIRFKNLIAEIQENRAIIISSHLIDDIDSLCSRVVILKQGNIVFQGQTEKLRDLALGKVYSVPYDMRNQMTQPYFIEKEKNVNGKTQLRVLSRFKQPGDIILPTVEDGYILTIQEQLCE